MCFLLPEILGKILRIPSEDVDNDVVLCYFTVRMSLLQFPTEWSVLAGLLHSFFLSIFYPGTAHFKQLDLLSLLVIDPRVKPVGLEVGGIRKQWNVPIWNYAIVLVHWFWLSLGVPGRSCTDEV